MFYKIARFLVKIFMHIMYSIHYEGVENIPTGQGYILVCNHRSLMDPLFIGIKLKPRLYFMAKAELFSFKPFGFILKHLGAFPVNRGKGDTFAIDHSIEIIEQGKVLAIFPEGTRSKNGKTSRAKSGTAVIAHKTGADIFACGISYEGKLSFRKHVTVRFGRLIPNAKLGITGLKASEIKQASEKIMREINRLVEGSHGDNNC